MNCPNYVTFHQAEMTLVMTKLKDWNDFNEKEKKLYRIEMTVRPTCFKYRIKKKKGSHPNGHLSYQKVLVHCIAVQLSCKKTQNTDA